MLISSKMAATLFESAEAVGIPRRALTEPLQLDADALTKPRSGLPWDTFVTLLDQLAVLVARDPERMREVGRKMVGIPSYSVFRRLASRVLAAADLYVIGERWIGPASVPHLMISTRYGAGNRLHFRASIPEPYAASAPYFHVFEGLLCALPTMIALPPAELVRTSVTPREMDATLLLPSSRSALRRVRQGVKRLLPQGRNLEMLEAQSLEIAEGLEAVQRSTLEIRSLFDRLPDLVIIHRAGRIVWTNRAVTSVLGYDGEADLHGRPLALLFDPASRELADRRTAGGTDDEATPALVEARLRARDGETVLVEVSPAEEVTFGGAPANLLVARDVTERTKLQQRLFVADRMASIGMLAAGVAHEVNNPLSYVLNNVEMAMRDLAAMGDRARASRDALGVALEGVDRIRTIVRELLALARVDDVGLGPLDAGGVVASTVALAAQKIATRATLQVDYRPVPLVRATASRIGQVVLNLLANALEAMPPEGRGRNVLSVFVGPARGGREVVIAIADNGSGISREHAARVFEPFYTTKFDGQGTGLGLAISQRLVDEMKGELSFESAPGVGTTFRVTLPALPDDATEGVRA